MAKTRTTEIIQRLGENPKLGDLRSIAREIKKDHLLAMELWATGQFHPMMLAILTMDKKELSPSLVDAMFADMAKKDYDQRLQLADWLMANQLTKDKKTLDLILSWKDDSKPLKRRIFWYYQGRLRWMGQPSPANTKDLLVEIEQNIAGEAPEVQWAMNFTAGWIGIFEPTLRQRCISIGENTGLLKGEMVSRGCTPNYLPEFIAIEARKRNL